MKLTIEKLTDAKKLEAADLVQQLYAIDKAIADLNAEKIVMMNTFGQKIGFLDIEKNKVTEALKALRTATLGV